MIRVNTRDEVKKGEGLIGFETLKSTREELQIHLRDTHHRHKVFSNLPVLHLSVRKKLTVYISRLAQESHGAIQPRTRVDSCICQAATRNVLATRLGIGLEKCWIYPIDNFALWNEG